MRFSLNGIWVDPTAQSDELQAAGLMATDAANTNYILIQTTAPVSAENRLALTSKSVEILEYIHENAYLCRYRETDLNLLRRLPFVSWVNTYLYLFKVPWYFLSRTDEDINIIQAKQLHEHLPPLSSRIHIVLLEPQDKDKITDRINSAANH